MKAWTPWIILSALVFICGIPQVKTGLDGIWTAKLPVAGLHNLVQKMPQSRAEDAAGRGRAGEGTGDLQFQHPLGHRHRHPGCRGHLRFRAPLFAARAPADVRPHALPRPLLAADDACMLALGYVTRYSGTDATMGLAFASTGWIYPLFGTLLGWLGVALTGSDTASNVLFGGLQRITAQQLGLNPVLTAAANSSGGVMGKMIDAQSIVVASTATRWYGHEGSILRYVFFHSIALAVLVGLLVWRRPMCRRSRASRRQRRRPPPLPSTAEHTRQSRRAEARVNMAEFDISDLKEGSQSAAGRAGMKTVRLAGSVESQRRRPSLWNRSGYPFRS
jgi:lactate permease